MRTMQPEARKRFLTRGRFGLGDLVIVMYRNVLDPSRVDVDLLAEDGTYHRGAFDVPTRETLAPRGIPTQFRVVLPEDEIGRITLLVVRGDARAFLQILKIDIAELPVIREAARIEIDAVFSRICVAFLLERLDHRDLRGNEIRCAWELSIVKLGVQRLQI